jgi:hypothetical protein
LGRYIFNGLTVLSLLVCLATGVLWVRGNWKSDLLYRAERGSQWTLDLGDGGVSVWHDKDVSIPGSSFGHISGRAHPPFAVAPVATHGGQIHHDISDHGWNYPGLSFRSQDDVWFDYYILSGNGGVRSVRRTKYMARLTASYWLIVLVTLILPASRLRLGKRQVAGHCAKCYYDLRATPDRCPECGHIPERDATIVGARRLK